MKLRFLLFIQIIYKLKNCYFSIFILKYKTFQQTKVHKIRLHLENNYCKSNQYSIVSGSHFNLIFNRQITHFRQKLLHLILSHDLIQFYFLPENTTNWNDCI